MEYDRVIPIDDEDASASSYGLKVIAFLKGDKGTNNWALYPNLAIRKGDIRYYFNFYTPWYLMQFAWTSMTSPPSPSGSCVLTGASPVPPRMVLSARALDTFI